LHVQLDERAAQQRCVRHLGLGRVGRETLWHLPAVLLCGGVGSGLGRRRGDLLAAGRRRRARQALRAVLASAAGGSDDAKHAQGIGGILHAAHAGVDEELDCAGVSAAKHRHGRTH
jgi:hypothetical protein